MHASIRNSLFTIVLAASAFAQSTPKSDDLTNLSVDDLINVQVTTVARRGQKLSETAAATFVITQEDIRRSGATTIPDLLRMVPGLDVAQVNGNIWAISARGFSGRWANKLLVMIDGRSVYSPLHGGVLWRTHDTLFDDIDRIEVTRGPGGTLWGANALNGIINIVTKHPAETQGAYATASSGINEGTTIGARYGGRLGDSGHFRIFAKGFNRPATNDASHATFSDDTAMRRGGFRAEWSNRFGTMNLQGAAYSGHANEINDAPQTDESYNRPFVDPHYMSGRTVMFRWTRTQ